MKGIGGTRNCNWWFTDEAILIDTAGRYTTQDDLDGSSKAGWEGFLNLLRRYRRSQPINGALVTLSIPDLLTRDRRSSGRNCAPSASACLNWTSIFTHGYRFIWF